MRPIDIIRQKDRFVMFDAKTKAKVLELNNFFGKYNMHFEERIKKLFTYYDTEDFALLKSNIVLFKTNIGNFCELNMVTEKTGMSTVIYVTRTMEKKFSKQIKPHDSILKHKDFLIESFKNMFFSSVNFDPEFLMQKLKPVYTIETISEEYRSSNGTGLKITYSFDTDIYTNLKNKVKTKQNVLTIYKHSGFETDEAYKDLLGKLTRYLKELTPTDETKIMIARKLTESKPVKNFKPKQENETKGKKKNK